MVVAFVTRPFFFNTFQQSLECLNYDASSKRKDQKFRKSMPVTVRSQEWSPINYLFLFLSERGKTPGAPVNPCQLSTSLVSPSQILHQPRHSNVPHHSADNRHQKFKVLIPFMRHGGQDQRHSGTLCHAMNEADLCRNQDSLFELARLGQLNKKCKQYSSTEDGNNGNSRKIWEKPGQVAWLLMRYLRLTGFSVTNSAKKVRWTITRLPSS